MKKVALHTLGCKLNYAETATIGRQFQNRGFTLVPLRQEADVIVLNTCSVTERADRECRQIIRRARRRSPHATIVVTGCYAQLQPEEIASIPGVDLVLGTREKSILVDHIANHHQDKRERIRVSDISDAAEASIASSVGSLDRTRGFLKIQDGCDYTCSFCTIPLARGGSRSVSRAAVLREAEALVLQGYKEIVLTGVNVGDYRDSSGNELEDILKILALIPGLGRIRVGSIEPNLLTDSLLDFWMTEPKMCRHFHMPLQSGSDDILKSMRRRYLRSRYDDRVKRILALDPEAAIGADVIVGYPGESDRHFLETYRFVADLPITYLHVFPYSERESTQALEIAGSVEPKTRFERAEKLRALGLRKRKLFHEKFEGTKQTVLVESTDREGRRVGLTGNYMKIRIADALLPINTFQTVQVQKFVFDEGLSEGELVSSTIEELRHALAP